MTLKEDIADNGTPVATYAIKCVQNDRYVGAGAAMGSTITAIYSKPDPTTHFQFRLFDHGTLGLYNVYHESFVSLVGYQPVGTKYPVAWQLIVGGQDRQWSEFSLDRNATDGDNDFWLRSTHPAAVHYPYIQVITQDRWLGVVKDIRKYSTDPLWQKLRAERI